MFKTVLVIGLAAGCGAIYFWSAAGRDDPHRNPALIANAPRITAPAVAHLADAASADPTQQAPLAAAALPVPEVAAPAPEGPAGLELWQAPTAAASTDLDGIPALVVRVDPKILHSLHVGQTLLLNVDDAGTQIAAEVASTYNDPQGVQVWQGSVKGGLPGSSLVIAQGQAQTHLLVTSEQGTYSAVIDHVTGEATIVDEGALMAGQASFDDAIPVAAFDDAPLPFSD